MNDEAITELDHTILEVLRAAGAPVREAVLFERVRSRGTDAPPERFQAALNRLAEFGHLHVAFDHDSAVRDAEPFEPRMWRVVR
jgi:hypothetical protein